MVQTFQQYNIFEGLTAARVVATSNQSGSYNNGITNNGVGAQFTYTATGAITIDSVVLNVGDRVLLQAQSAALQNGVYVYNGANSAGQGVLQRSADQQNIEQMKTGQYITIAAGSVNAGSAFVLVEPLPQALGVSNVVWTASPLNSGLGTAAAKAASDNASPTLASVEGAPVISGNIVTFSGTAGSIADSGISPSGIPLVASVAMTAAQFNGMYAAPFLLIAAPGANKLIVVHKMDAIMTFVSADYAAGGVVAAQYDSTVHGAGVLATNTEAAADFFAAASTTFQFSANSGNTVGAMPFSTTVNKGLYLSNQTGAFTTGDSTWVIKVFYSIIATA